MKINVGMYCYVKHSRDYGIGKVVYIRSNGFAEKQVEIQFKNSKHSVGYSSVVASPDIIDLVEYKDVLVLLDVEYGEKYKAEVIKDNEDDLCVINFENDKLIDLRISLFKGDIKLLEIITREQIEQVSYEVGEE